MLIDSCTIIDFHMLHSISDAVHVVEVCDGCRLLSQLVDVQLRPRFTLLFLFQFLMHHALDVLSELWDILLLQDWTVLRNDTARGIFGEHHFYFIKFDF